MKRNRTTLRHVQTKNRRRGAALVEFAVTLPIVFLLFTGMIEIGRVMMLQHSLDTAAYEGARAGMVPGANASEAVSAANNLLNAAGVKSYKVTVLPQVITESTPVITVQVEAPMGGNSWITPTWFTNSVVNSEVSLICERPPFVQLTGIPLLKKGNANKIVSSVISP